MGPLHLMLAALIRWIAGEQQAVIEHLITENRVLKAQLRGRRVRLSDAERRRLALLGTRLGRPILTEVATIVRPDTLSLPETPSALPIASVEGRQHATPEP